MNFRSVLVVTYGRSGSTLLQGVLNTIDGCLVRGENYSFCQGLFDAWRALAQTRTRHANEKLPTMPFFGAPELDPDGFLDDVRELVRRQLLGSADPATVRCLGFKEVRYFDKVPPDLLPEFLDFLSRLFADPAFVFLRRDHASVAASSWWQKADREVLLERLRGFEEITGRWAEGRKNVFFLDYAALAGHGPEIRELFAFLGADYDRGKVAQVLSTEHSFSNATNPRELARRIEFAVVPCAGLVDIVLDPLPDGAVSTQPQLLGGVIVPGPARQARARLELRGPAGNQAVTWGLPSPVVAERHPLEAFAQSARFRVEGVDASLGPVDLCLIDADGNVLKVARLG